MKHFSFIALGLFLPLESHGAHGTKYISCEFGAHVNMCDFEENQGWDEDDTDTDNTDEDNEDNRATGTQLYHEVHQTHTFHGPRNYQSRSASHLQA